MKSPVLLWLHRRYWLFRWRNCWRSIAIIYYIFRAKNAYLYNQNGTCKTYWKKTIQRNICTNRNRVKIVYVDSLPRNRAICCLRTNNSGLLFRIVTVRRGDVSLHVVSADDVGFPRRVGFSPLGEHHERVSHRRAHVVVMFMSPPTKLK